MDVPQVPPGIGSHGGKSQSFVRDSQEDTVCPWNCCPSTYNVSQELPVTAWSPSSELRWIKFCREAETQNLLSGRTWVTKRVRKQSWWPPTSSPVSFISCAILP